MPFTSPIFTKLTTAQQRYMHIFYIAFYSNWKKNVENKNRITFTVLADEWLSMHQSFIKCETAQQHYMEIFSEFGANHSIYTEITRRNSFTPVSKMQLSLNQPNHNYATTICKEILHHVSRHFNRRFSC